MSELTDDKVWSVFNVVKREGHKDIWQKIGVAFTNDNGSINVITDCHPMNGKYVLQKKDHFTPSHEGTVVADSGDFWEGE